MKAVLDSKPESAYKDDIARWYHFPSRYRDIITQSVGDWVIYRQPRSGGGHMGYFGVARVVGIRDDPEQNNHYYADIADFLGNYIHP